MRDVFLTFAGADVDDRIAGLDPERGDQAQRGVRTRLVPADLVGAAAGIDLIPVFGPIAHGTNSRRTSLA
jgi:hypothetical protein